MCSGNKTIKTKILGRIALSICLLAGGVLAAEKTDTRVPAEVKEVALVIFGQPYTGQIVLPVTEEGFQFRPRGTTDLLTFKWSALEESERTRVRQLAGLATAETASPTWGEDVSGLRLKLKTGRTLEGLLLPERSRPGFRCLKTATQQVMVPEPDIVSEEKAVLKECRVFTPEEGYERLLLRRPPGNGNANDHLELARICGSMGLYGKALDHLEIASTIDARVAEQNKDLLNDLKLKESAQTADGYYARILKAVQAEDHGTALARCEEFIRSFPNDERRSRVEKMRTELEPRRTADLQRMVVNMYYASVGDLLQKRMGQKVKVDDRGLPVPAIPGKLVTTRAHQQVRGLLVSEDGEKIVLKDPKKDLTIEIPFKDVLAVNDLDLSEGVKMVDPTFEELKTYASDADTGLGSDIVARVAKTLRISEAEVRDLWDRRFTRRAVVENGFLKPPVPLVSPQTAQYGEGSWLREGTAAVRTANTASLPGKRRGSQQNAAALNGTVDPGNSDDPEVWWKVQSAEGKLNILRALAAEALFEVKELKGKPCPECAGRGTTMVTGNAEPQRCPVCRGLKKLVAVIYE